jgi:hypothetical protein
MIQQKKIIIYNKIFLLIEFAKFFDKKMKMMAIEKDEHN